ncbi:MAG: zinc-binding dehydrogenase [Fimbriimonadaceae bacterium]|nr:zinc-binding dehydrogenase [Fimbriimonadaceae bacterium]
MQIVAIEGARKAAIVERPDPHPRGEFVVVRVEVAPMCTEYKGWMKGWVSDCLGHEAAGTVEAVEGDRRVKEGQRVLVMPQFPCGACELCRIGEFVYCERSLNPLAETGNAVGIATYAQRLIKQDWMLIPIPDDISTEHASLANCALGPAFGALKRMRVSGLDTVLITGLGPVGLGATILARRFGARVIGTDPSAYRRNLAEELGAHSVLDPTDPDALAQIRAMANGRGVDAVVECAGAPSAQRFALDAVRRLGRVAWVGEAQELTVHVSNDFIRKGLEVVGSWYYNLADTGVLMDWIRALRPELDRLITHRFPMAEVERAFALQEAAACGKILLAP